MIDLCIIRSNPDLIKSVCARRGCDIDVDAFLTIDREYRNLLTELENLKAEQNKLGRNDVEQARKLKIEILSLNKKKELLEKKRDDIWHIIPNLLSDDVPDGKSDADNVVIREWGLKPCFNYTPKNHEEIGEKLDILDTKRGAKVAKAGFYFWKNDGALLTWAVFNYAIDFLMKKGFSFFMTPIVGKDNTFFGTGYFPFFEGETFKIENENLNLIGTSEQTLVAFHGDENLSTLPLKYTAFSPCLRTEKGAYGKETRGIFRVHQFHKVEQIIFCKPEESVFYHNYCLEVIEEFMQSLCIPYRIVNVCIGDLGAPAYKKYDLESWFAGFGSYRETHSNSNLIDYQARRLNIKYKDKESGKNAFVHTISSTMVTDRTVLSILENFQQEDGSVKVPDVLKHYFHKEYLGK